MTSRLKTSQRNGVGSDSYGIEIWRRLDICLCVVRRQRNLLLGSWKMRIGMFAAFRAIHIERR